MLLTGPGIIVGHSRMGGLPVATCQLPVASGPASAVRNSNPRIRESAITSAIMYSVHRPTRLALARTQLLNLRIGSAGQERQEEGKQHATYSVRTLRTYVLQFLPNGPSGCPDGFSPDFPNSPRTSHDVTSVLSSSQSPACFRHASQVRPDNLLPSVRDHRRCKYCTYILTYRVPTYNYMPILKFEPHAPEPEIQTPAPCSPAVCRSDTQVTYNPRRAASV